MDFSELYRFWFGEGDLGDAGYVGQRMKFWFAKNEKADAEIRARFAPLLAQPGLTAGWEASARGLLSKIVLYDQIPRNSFRGQGHEFDFDETARALTREIFSKGYDRALTPVEMVFVLLPLEHSEDLVDQDECVRLFTELAARTPESIRPTIAATVDYAKRHRAVIARFGRFPHRNQILGRPSTPEELEFLKQPGSSF